MSRVGFVWRMIEMASFWSVLNLVSFALSEVPVEALWAISKTSRLERLA